jgi:hypothetical protein
MVLREEGTMSAGNAILTVFGFFVLLVLLVIVVSLL